VTVPASPTRSSNLGGAIAALWVPIVLVIAAFCMSGYVAIQHSQEFSPVDEWVYTDYLIKLPTEGVVHEGEAVGQEALGLMACDGVTPYGPMGQPCGTAHYQHSRFPFGGITSADAYTPAYFALTALFGKAVHQAFGINQLTAWRLSGGVWLAIAMVLLFAVLRRFGVPRLAGLALGLAVIASPFSWWTYSYISTDAPSLAFGLLLLLFAIDGVARRRSLWWLVPISVVAVAFKVTNLLGVGLSVIYVLVAWVLARVRQRRSDAQSGYDSFERTDTSVRVALAAGAAAVAGLATQVCWMAIRAALAVGTPASQGIGVPLSARELASQITNFLPGTIVANVDISGSTGVAYDIPQFITAPLSWLCVTGVLGCLAIVRLRSREAPIVLAAAIGALLFAPLLTIMLRLVSGSYFPLPPRYGAPVLGAMLLCAGILIRSRIAIYLVLAYAVALYAFVLVTAPHYSG